jgi:formate dehydrogenase subunit gamma
MATDPDGRVVRYRWAARLFHEVVAVVTLVLLFTGWWLLSGHEGQPSVVARLLGRSDTDVHRRAGWVLAVVCAVGVTVGVRAAVTFVRESLRYDRGDTRWFFTWPRGALTGRFSPHRRHFDPGQRVANVLFVVTLGALIGSGIALTTLHGGPTFVWLVRIHRDATYVLVALIALHVFLAVGALPGYRGAWRSMHLRGRIRRETAARLWPASVDGTVGDAADDEPDRRVPDRREPVRAGHATGPVRDSTRTGRRSGGGTGI